MLAARRLTACDAPCQLLALLSGSFIAANAILFGLESGGDAHIRYALPNYIIIHIVVVTLSAVWIYQRICMEGHSRSARAQNIRLGDPPESHP